ncbi:copper amine oxidase N-terminal domain-containing protein [Tepidibacter hydrothermalis]|uniref:Copper amine oxidase N-terminal domain-containing protein n=1 Tax=Tepidibacter hydrothermalis TaxID=3036126 RepID=A0ABY8E804_9FIRM|nr:copper amine oxidase N-terminal domain-containing protein [Tepidibacter hydrothermalis]WFD09036.1 copper amine oxidase N-terminal domain-containing protein [Tepidibacter hydrothermalis]
MKRYFKYLITTFALILTLFNCSFAQDISVYVNNSKLEIDTASIIKDGRTLVPVRAIFEALGCEVRWDASTKTVTGIKGNKQIKLVIDGVNAKVNESEVKLDVPAMIVNSRTLVPVRFISESLDCNVKWDGDTNSVYITTLESGNENTEDTKIEESSAGGDLGELKDLTNNTVTVGEELYYTPNGNAKFSMWVIKFNKPGYKAYIRASESTIYKQDAETQLLKVLNNYLGDEANTLWSKIKSNIENEIFDNPTEEIFNGKTVEYFVSGNGDIVIYIK